MHLLNPSPWGTSSVIGVLRIVIGIFLIYHGQEVFHPEIMDVYFSWDAFKSGNGHLLAYVGKYFELAAGILLFLGLCTRIGALLCIGVMCFITFMLGHGKVWYDDQHPFLLVLFGILFFFAGPGAWSLDARLFDRKI